MPANEASGIGGRSYGRIALYLLQVSLVLKVSLEIPLIGFMYAYPAAKIFCFLVVQGFKKAPLVNKCILMKEQRKMNKDI